MKRGDSLKSKQAEKANISCSTRSTTACFWQGSQTTKHTHTTDDGSVLLSSGLPGDEGWKLTKLLDGQLITVYPFGQKLSCVDGTLTKLFQLTEAVNQNLVHIIVPTIKTKPANKEKKKQTENTKEGRAPTVKVTENDFVCCIRSEISDIGLIGKLELNTSNDERGWNIL